MKSSYEKGQPRKVARQTRAKGIAGLLGRSRETGTSITDSTLDERTLKHMLAMSQERAARQEKIAQVAAEVDSIVQGQLPDTLPKDEKTGLKKGVHEVKKPNGETVKFSHFPRHTKMYGGALSTIETESGGVKRTIELTDGRGLVDLTLITEYQDGRFERFRTLSDQEFALTHAIRLARDVDDLAELCLKEAQYAQTGLSGEPENRIPADV